LASVVNESAAEKLLRAKKIIIPLEQNSPNETSARITKDLRFTLRTVLKSKEATPEEVAQAGDLLLRVKALGVRREEFRTKNGNEGAEVDSLEDHPIVAGTSASHVPRTTGLTYNSIFESLDSVFGNAWRWSGKDFSQEERLNFIENILGSKPTVSAVKALQLELYKKDSRGFTLAGTFSLVAQFVKEYLVQHGVADASKFEDEERTIVEKWKADLDAEMSK
jgi:hypothetical protein